MGNIWAIVFPHNAYNVAHIWEKQIWHTNVDMIWETMWPIFGLGAGATCCPYTALMNSVANILPIYCPYGGQYMGHEIIFGRV